jgi:hypothetical protein
MGYGARRSAEEVLQVVQRESRFNDGGACPTRLEEFAQRFTGPNGIPRTGTFNTVASRR